MLHTFRYKFSPFLWNYTYKHMLSLTIVYIIFFFFLSFNYVNFNYNSPHSILSLDFITKHLICLWIPFLTQALHLFLECVRVLMFCVDWDFNSISKDVFLSFSVRFFYNSFGRFSIFDKYTFKRMLNYIIDWFAGSSSPEHTLEIALNL